MITDISSPHNKICKNIKKLHSRNGRDKLQLFISEGSRLVGEAVASGLAEYVVIASDYSGELPESTQIYRVDNSIFSNLAQTTSAQGILAVCKLKPTLEHAEIMDKQCVVMCDKISDPGNLGAIIRTAECAGIGGVVLSRGCADIYNAKTVRATMGAIFRIPILTDSNLTDIISNGNFCGVAMSLDGAVDLYSADFSHKTAIVIGSEANGVSDDVLSACRLKVKIPMSGGESLNAAVAAGIVMYEYRRKIIC